MLYILIPIGCIAAVLITAGLIARRTPHGTLNLTTAIFLSVYRLSSRKIDPSSIPLDRLRRNSAALTKWRRVRGITINNLIIPGKGGNIPVRIHIPSDSVDTPLPGMLYFHGGGFVLGGLDTHSTVCGRLARGLRMKVIAVDYRLAPESPFPAAVDDCYDALVWCASHPDHIRIKTAPLYVAGDSAGGNLAAVVCRRARDLKGPAAAAQILIYPVTDPPNLETESHLKFGEGFFLTDILIRWFRAQYVPDRLQWRHPDAAPLLVDNLGGLPPAVVVTAAFDPLRDEGEAYARRLEEAGVPVVRQRMEGTIHGYFGMFRRDTVRTIKFIAANLPLPAEKTHAR